MIRENHSLGVVLKERHVSAHVGEFFFLLP